MRKSKKTTVAGILAALGLLFGMVSAMIDGDPETVVTTEQWGLLVAAVGVLFSGVFARDDNVSSEGTTAKKNEKK